MPERLALEAAQQREAQKDGSDRWLYKGQASKKTSKEVRLS